MGFSSSKKKVNNDIKRNSNIFGEKDNKAIYNFISRKIQKQNSIKGKSEIETLKIILNDNLPKPTKWSKDKIWSFRYQKVLLGYLNAYFDHCPIKMSPNVIWQLTLNNFSKYVNDNSERLRKIFVNFEGKKDIECVRVGLFDDVYKYKDDLIEEFCYKISENIGNELTDILTPNFTTSTKDSIIAGKVSIMSTFKNILSIEHIYYPAEFHI